MNTEIKIIIPKGATSNIEEGLVHLTKILVTNKLADSYGGFLGGEFGYGTDFENDTFKIHHYCWCENKKCPYCNGEEPNFKHKSSGLKISWYKYIGRSMEYKKRKPSIEQWNKILKECVESIKNE